MVKELQHLSTSKFFVGPISIIEHGHCNLYMLFNRGQKSGDKKGLGTTIPHDLREGDDEFDAYRKRMMVAYRFRPNPLVRI